MGSKSGFVPKVRWNLAVFVDVFPPEIAQNDRRGVGETQYEDLQDRNAGPGEQRHQGQLGGECFWSRPGTIAPAADRPYAGVLARRPSSEARSLRRASKRAL